MHRSSFLWCAIVGNVSEATLREALNRIANAGNILRGRRTFAYLVCDQDIYEQIQAIQKKDPETYGWVRLLPAEWHVSLCVRLTIGATWGKTFLASMVQSVEGCTKATAEFLVRGTRWRRSGTIFFQAARGVTRSMLSRWRNSDSYSVESHKQGAAFRKWLIHQGELNPYVKHVTDFAKAVGLNLSLDLAMREGDYDKCVKCALYFHALACSRGRFNYKDLLGQQIINWAECTEAERKAIAAAAFAPALNGTKISRDEEYEALIKLVKAQMHPGLMNDSHLVRATLMASYCGIVQERANLFLRWVFDDGDALSAGNLSTRPKSASSLSDRAAINSYANWLLKNFIKQVNSPTEDMLMPDGICVISYAQLTRVGSGMINPVLNQCFESGRKQSEGYLTATFIRAPIPVKRSRAPPAVIATKKQRKATQDREMKHKNKEQGAQLKKTERLLHVANLRASYLAQKPISADELSGLKRKELAEIGGIEKFQHKSIAQLQSLICGVDERNDQHEEEEEEEEEEECAEEHVESVSNLVVLLRRTPSGEHWQGAGVLQRGASQEEVTEQDIEAMND